MIVLFFSSYSWLKLGSGALAPYIECIPCIYQVLEKLKSNLGQFWETSEILMKFLQFVEVEDSLVYNFFVKPDLRLNQSPVNKDFF